jgi:hypothetical protein
MLESGDAWTRRAVSDKFGKPEQRARSIGASADI